MLIRTHCDQHPRYELASSSLALRPSAPNEPVLESLLQHEPNLSL